MLPRISILRRKFLILPCCIQRSLGCCIGGSKLAQYATPVGHNGKVELLQSPTVNVSRCPFAPLYQQISRSIHKSWPKLLDEQASKTKMTAKQRLKNTVKEYGSTIVVFHIILSVSSFAACYLVVSSGVDVAALALKMGLDLEGLSAKIHIPASSGTFVLTYALYKIFSPLRLALTLTVAPFIVRHLRRVGAFQFTQKTK
ncbi:protein FAM210B, mitochondrial-like [Ornithodoros turicata]|uniref:protein FAM210B, mitochondrial-like n=1 Tax=Ornithodoros turicata TaxID=34597 RepID=UPI003139490B